VPLVPQTAKGQSDQATNSVLTLLNTWFSYFQNNDFDAIFRTLPKWQEKTAALAQLPSFEREDQLKAIKLQAREEFYTSDQYGPIAAHALKKPKVTFLEEAGGKSYFRLNFVSPEQSPTSFAVTPPMLVQERIVSVVPRYPELFFSVEQKHDKYWTNPPLQITSVELDTIGDDYRQSQYDGIRIWVQCPGPFNCTGTARLNAATIQLSATRDNQRGRGQLVGMFKGTLPLASARCEVSVKIPDGRVSKAFFNCVTPQSGRRLLADTSYGKEDDYRMCRLLWAQRTRPSTLVEYDDSAWLIQFYTNLLKLETGAASNPTPTPIPVPAATPTDSPSAPPQPQRPLEASASTPPNPLNRTELTAPTNASVPSPPAPPSKVLDPPTLIKDCVMIHTSERGNSSAVRNTEVFNRDYKNKRLKYSGVIASVNKKSGAVMFAKSGDWPLNWQVESPIPQDKLGLLDSLQKGQQLTIEGEISELKMPVPDIKGGILGTSSRTIRLQNTRIVEQ